MPLTLSVGEPLFTASTPVGGVIVRGGESLSIVKKPSAAAQFIRNHDLIIGGEVYVVLDPVDIGAGRNKLALRERTQGLATPVALHRLVTPMMHPHEALRRRCRTTDGVVIWTRLTTNAPSAMSWSTVGLCHCYELDLTHSANAVFHVFVITVSTMVRSSPAVGMS